MTEEQTLVMYSGHPMGYFAFLASYTRLLSSTQKKKTSMLNDRLFPSTPSGPRVVVTNGMVVPNYSSKEMYDQMYALGVSMYGQMTAGSYCCIHLPFFHSCETELSYLFCWFVIDIGPQGIVHGTTITLLNAGRKYLDRESLQVLFTFIS